MVAYSQYVNKHILRIKFVIMTSLNNNNTIISVLWKYKHENEYTHINETLINKT